MERTWYIIADKDGNEIRTASKREAQTAFRCDAPVTIVLESVIHCEEVMIVTQVYSGMKTISNKEQNQ